VKQVCLAEGEIRVVEVPAPMAAEGRVLVRTSHSLISTGTELAATRTSGGTLALLRHAIANPALVRKVWDRVGAVGIRQTAELVRARQQSMLALGYSASGVIVEIGAGVEHLRVGDRVACAGAGFANHAEAISVPVNLVARVPDGVSLEDAAFATVGAIALHGVRRAEPTLGEQIVVVGLGLIGQITVQLLRAHGARVFGADLREDRLALARTFGMEAGASPQEGRTADAVADWTLGAGADAVIVCASSGNAALLNESFDLCRRRGRVVLVGDVPIRIARDRIYKKELDFRISTSYGPGRYDSRYEEKGHDYPLGYVRWTEGRNLAEVLRLVASGELNLGGLQAQVSPVDAAADAYARLKLPDAPIALLLRYGQGAEPARHAKVVELPVRASAGKTGDVVLGVIGAGAFFRGVHLPNLQKHGGFFIKTIVSRTGLAARDYATRAGVPRAATSADEVLGDPEINAVLIATRHDAHASLVAAAAAAGKHVFVEKPLALTPADARMARDAAAAASVLVSVGFNRRFSPLALAARDAAARAGRSKIVIYRVNAGQLPADHWLLDPVQGGGRIRGEGVHFLDWVRWVVGSEVAAVTGRALRSGGRLQPDDLSIVVELADGSLATVIYAGEGAGRSGKERIEIFGGNQTVLLDDFQKLDVYTGGSHTSDHRKHVEKGHFEILENFYRAIRGEAPLGVTADDGVAAAEMAEAAIRSSRAAGA
jgi:predicted dehydrogenase/threonine dehydrogenase-like Zn-dependent dehydrogenase